MTKLWWAMVLGFTFLGTLIVAASVVVAIITIVLAVLLGD